MKTLKTVSADEVQCAVDFLQHPVRQCKMAHEDSFVESHGTRVFSPECSRKHLGCYHWLQRANSDDHPLLSILEELDIPGLNRSIALTKKELTNLDEQFRLVRTGTTHSSGLAKQNYHKADSEALQALERRHAALMETLEEIRVQILHALEVPVESHMEGSGLVQLRPATD